MAGRDEEVNIPTNPQREAWARIGLASYAHVRGTENDNNVTEEAENMLTDLLHLIKSQGGDVGFALRSATTNYLDEQGLVGL